jgi:phosphoglycolate phosphatase-like HAD superfamily hydrolase
VQANSTEIVVLDFDGTVVDSMPFLIDVAVSLITSRYGTPADEAREGYVETCGLPFSRQIEILFPNDGRNRETARLFEGEKRSHLMEFELFPDVLPAVSRLRKHGIKVCISSGNKQDLITRLLGSRGLDVDLIMGYRPGFMKGPDHFEFARQTFGSSLDRVVFVGDSRVDWQTARDMGVGFIARVGLHTSDEIELLLPGVPFVESLGEILPILGIIIAQEDRGDAHPPELS